MSEKNLKQCLIFGGETKTLNNDQIEEQLDEIDNSNQDLAPSERKERPSPYVQVFESMSTRLAGVKCESVILLNSYGPYRSGMRVGAPFYGRS